MNLLFHASLKQMNSFEAKNREDDSTGIDSSETIADGDENNILDTVLLRVVVRSKADD